MASLISLELHLVNKIQPIYKLANIPDQSLTNLLTKVFAHTQLNIKENLNNNILKKYHLISRQQALQNLHLPINNYMLQQSIKRFKYEEALRISKKWFTGRANVASKTPLHCDIIYIKQMIAKIPFALTENQKEIINDIYKDFRQPFPVCRLIQGDVGTGKTITVFIAALGIISLNKQVLIMVPTEILAQQHYRNFKKFFPEIKAACLTSKSEKKKEIEKEIQENKIAIVFGTHLLATTIFKQLSLIIIDETHKFGIDIQKKTQSQNEKSDILYLTATPIPKTLITMYLGFVKISLLKNKPYTKREIKTQKCSLEEAIINLKHNQKQNRQTYIIVPAIQDKSKYFNIHKVISILKQNHIEHLYVLHGKKNTQQQEEIMTSFVQDKKGILLATSIIEVGIDVPNATMMIILGAEYFGLSQLHQFRGRVGRNNYQNYCFLVAHKQHKRLDMLVKENDGLKLSEFDLKNRGPGDFLGKKQSGFFKYHFLNIIQDLPIILKVQKDFQDLQFIPNIFQKKSENSYD